MLAKLKILARLGATFAVALMVFSLWSVEAQACRGTHEFPETAARLAEANIHPNEKRFIEQALKRASKIHENAHAKDNGDKMRESLERLDEINNRF